MGMSRVSVVEGDSTESAVTVLDRLPPASSSAWLTVWSQVKVQDSSRSSAPSLSVSPES